MHGVLLVAWSLLGLVDDPSGPSPTGAASATAARDEPDSYEAALAQAGRGADAHVRLALWCEARGLDAERLKHLSLAVLNDPAHPLARALLGLVSYNGRWKRPEAVGDAVAADAARRELMAEYEARRDNLTGDADSHWKLALWCEENGLKAEATAHLWAAVRVDPSREEAWKKLGRKKQKDGRWLTDAQSARARDEAELQKHADRHWKPLLERWRAGLAKKDAAGRDAAGRELSSVTDPRAVPSVWAVFATGDEARQKVAVQVLGQINDAAASRALAMLAVSSPSAEVRRLATETLTLRDVREFGQVLVALLREPIKYEIRHVNGPGSTGELFIHGKKANLKRLYSSPGAPNVAVMPGDVIKYDANGLPVVASYGRPFHTGRIPISNLIDRSMIGTPTLLDEMSWSHYGVPPAPQLTEMQQVATGLVASSRLGMGNGLDFNLVEERDIPVGRMVVEAQKTAMLAEQQLQNDVATIERFNEPIVKDNERVLPILKAVSGQDLGSDRATWAKWWIDQIGMTTMPQKFSQPTPTVVEDVPLAYQPAPIPVADFYHVTGYHQVSCFGAGTPVHTLTGPRPIETLEVGDEVLAQDVTGGALGYRPIVAVHHNPPSKTFRIALGGETIVSSEFHRFWKAGRGWVLARDLKPSDTLRTLGGVARVESIEEGEVQPVYNLDVAEDADFFAGKLGALVHDNTLPDLRVVPFDAPTPLASASASARP